MMRKIVCIPLILSGLFSAYILFFVIWTISDSFIEDYIIWFTDIYFVVFWMPIICSVISLIFITLGVIMALKRKKWWLVFVGSIFTLLMPIVYPLINLQHFARVQSNIALFVSIVAIILTLLSMKDFRKISPNLQNP
jgi:hypothetical protein